MSSTCTSHEEQTARKLALKKTAMEGRPFGCGSAGPKEGLTLTGAQAIIASLEAEGVEVLFGYPGGTAIRIFDALYDSDTVHRVLARHEQGATHMADGYARATGKPGVVLVTSGPGATNTVTGIATAYMDSVPLVVITSQVNRAFMGTDAFQEADILGITLPIVKHSFLVTDVTEIPTTFREAFYVATTGRPGPVLIDVPANINTATCEFHYPDSVDLPSYRPNYKGNNKQVKAAVNLIAESKRPVIYAGGGIVSSHACAELRALAELICAPVVLTLMGKGVFPSDHELYLGPVGMHGSKYANMAMTKSDLIICVGARFSERVTGKRSEFAPDAKVIHIDIDPAEIGKNRNVDVPIVGDAQMVLQALDAQLRKAGVGEVGSDWARTCAEWRQRWPLFDERERAEHPGQIIPEVALTQLSGKLDPESTIVTTEVGQHQMWAHQCIDRMRARSFISSGGLGTMGFGFPAAIGAQMAFPTKQVICIAGDGSFQMNLQEMATAVVQKAPVKVVLLNNHALGMVHQWQELFCDGRYCATELDDTPDMMKLADAYGWDHARVSDPAQVDAALDAMLASEGPYMLELMIAPERHVYPMVAPGSAIDDIIGAIDLKCGGERVSVKGMGTPARYEESIRAEADSQEVEF